MDVWLVGAGWITANGHGRLGEGKRMTLSPGAPVVPELRSVLNRPVSRYGRFDAFTRLGLTAVALALKDAGWLEAPPAEPVGLVVSSVLEVLQTDFVYYRTTLEQSGLLSSPNLFSYTLPVAVLGECASNFGLTGPTFVLGDDGNAGGNALAEALSLMAAGEADKMIAGWIDSPQQAADLLSEPEALSGAVFVALDANLPVNSSSFAKLIYHESKIVSEDGRRISSPADLLNSIRLIR